MNLHRENGIRRRMELNPITTSLQITPPHHQIPGSAISGNVSSAFGYNPSQYNTPLSSVRQYNPSQWTSSPSISGGSDGSHYSARTPHDPDVVIPAPPPYSPPRSNRPAGGSDEPMSSASAPPQAYRSSPDAPHTPHTPAPSTPHPNYPPPPGGRSRAGSNDRPHGIFGFSRRSVNHSENPRMSPASNREPIPPVPPIPRRAVEPTRPEGVEPVPVNVLPPGSRRAASTGAINSASPAHSRDPSNTRWQPGMPLPPPPPGLPPPPRSQSMTRAPETMPSPPTRRPLPSSSLGPVPPTPLSPPIQASAAASNWPEETPTAPSPRNRLEGPTLHLDTSSVSSSTAADSISESSSSSLARSRAVRGEKTIRERRSESRSGRTAYPESAIEQSNNPWAEAITPSDIVVPLARRQTITRATPRSGRSSNYSETPRSSQPMQHSLTTPDRNGPLTGSRGSTPRPVAPTPPFSPETIKSSTVEHSPSVPPKSLPTPPPQSRMAQKTPNGRPPSLTIPKNDSTVISASTPSRPATGKSVSSQMSHMTPNDDFACSAAERHEIFVQREASATNDTERVRIFAEFIVNESRIRRDRYASAIDAMGSEILDLTRDLFRPNARPRRDSSMSRASEYTPESSAAPRSHRGSLVAAMKEDLQSQRSEPRSGSRPPTRPTSRSNSRPGSRANSAGPPSPVPSTQQNPQWWSQPGYMPSLSPIPSMSVSEALDGASSRGRPSSRWWEVSQQGSDGIPSSRFERSKRESKYMGMPKELREALQFGEGDQSSGSPMENAFGGPSNPAHLGPNEYPQEKVGFQEPNQETPIWQPIIQPSQVPLTPSTPNPEHLDVSRLVTLPPPYPRHHPAVNNNHPDLTSIRTTVRTLSDITEVAATKERFLRDSAQMREDQNTTASKRRASLRLRIQRDIEAGTISYADAAAYEAESVTSELLKSKEAAKSIFELFQSQVVLPVNELLMTRIQSATDLFEKLRSKLFNDSRDQNPTSTQEEGDEQPELIEKLTLLKWIFEAREQLHREVYELLSDRNDRYKEMIITPYRLSNNVEKVRGAEAFFAEDAQKRKQAFESEILKRTEEFMDIIEENVVRGVEVQLGAFWDIAPSLSRLVEQIPHDGDLDGFMIQIPKDEYEENPSYYDFPLQYLYTLLVHTGKSAYQFIESQTNLLCLLHEVKVGVTAANCRLMGTQRVAQGEAKEEVERELEAVKREEEGRLTDDLKEKVMVVEELWRSGLGTELEGVRGRILRWLKRVGGELPPDDEA